MREPTSPTKTAHKERSLKQIFIARVHVHRSGDVATARARNLSSPSHPRACRSLQLTRAEPSSRRRYERVGVPSSRMRARGFYSHRVSSSSSGSVAHLRCLRDLKRRMSAPSSARRRLRRDDPLKHTSFYSPRRAFFSVLYIHKRYLRSLAIKTDTMCGSFTTDRKIVRSVVTDRTDGVETRWRIERARASLPFRARQSVSSPAERGVRAKKDTARTRAAWCRLVISSWTVRQRRLRTIRRRTGTNLFWRLCAGSSSGNRASESASERGAR